MPRNSPNFPEITPLVVPLVSGMEQDLQHLWIGGVEHRIDTMDENLHLEASMASFHFVFVKGN